MILKRFMNLHKKIQEINKRWNIPDDKTDEEKFLHFKTGVLNIFSDIDNRVSQLSITEFCNALGIDERWKSAFSGNRWSENIINALKRENEPREFFKLIEIIFALDIEGDYDSFSRELIYDRTILYKNIDDALRYSGIGVSIAEKDGDVFLYLSGEELLDETLVNGGLSFLSGQAQNHFIDSLKFYDKATSGSRVKSAESLRRSLEEFLRKKLNNTKGLKANINDLGKNLKEIEGANDDIRKLVMQIISLLDHPFFNDNSKHKDGNINEKENEYLIYQIALLMRYIERSI